MKLVDILARELKVWPEESPIDVGQAADGDIYIPGKSGVFSRHIGAKLTLADDWNSANVTRAQWQAAVDSLMAENCAHLWVGWSNIEACELCNATRKIVVEWNGEGLPPVGTALDWREKTGSQWVEATVLFITDSSVVLQRDDGFEWQMLTKATVFRPLRTAEQLAAEEAKNAELNRMVATASIIDKSWARKVCSDLYDAGYRKFEIVDN